MKKYYKVMLGPKSIYAGECFKNNFIGIDYGFDFDLSGRLPENWKQFNQEFIPVFISKNPGKEKIGAGLACGFTWNLTKGISIGDIVICPNGDGDYVAGEVTGNYFYVAGGILPHRRNVRWLGKQFSRQEMSLAFKNSTGTTNTVSDVTKYADEIEKLISGEPKSVIVSNDETIEDASTFALEKHLEDFLVQNWKQTELGKKYDIYQDGELLGRQFPSDTGPIDILAISNDKKVLLVVELKRGRASDHVVGQVQRYMGYVLQELAEDGQTVKGAIIALEDDLKIRRALAVTTNIEFYTYQVSFKLVRV